MQGWHEVANSSKHRVGLYDGGILVEAGDLSKSKMMRTLGKSAIRECLA